MLNTPLTNSLTIHMLPIFMGINIIVNFIVAKFNLPISYRLIQYIIGILLGGTHLFDDYVGIYLTKNEVQAPTLYFVYSATLFYLSFEMDMYVFSKSWGQILILGVIGGIIASLIFGYIVVATLDIRFREAFCLSLCAIVVFPIDLIYMLRRRGFPLYVCTLLEGEMLCSLGIEILFHSIWLHLPEDERNVQNILKLLFTTNYMLYEISVGIGVGFVTKLLINQTSNDVKTCHVIMYIAAIQILILSSEFLTFCGVISLTIVALFIATNRHRMPQIQQANLRKLVGTIFFNVHGILSLIIGIHLGVNFPSYIKAQFSLLTIVLYVAVTCTRAFIFILLSPLLSRTGYGLTWNNAVLAIWTCSGGNTPLLTIIFLTKDLDSHSSSFTLISIEILLLLINGTTTSSLMNIMGIKTISNEDKNSTAKAIAKIMQQNKIFLSNLKQNRFLAGANWNLITSKTKLLNPFRGQKTISAHSFNTEFKTKDCPECEKEIREIPNTAELNEMLREARFQILKYRRIIFRRLFESGLISKNTLTLLNKAIDMAMKETSLKIPINELFRNWQLPTFRSKARNFFLHVSQNEKIHKSVTFSRNYRRFLFAVANNVIYEISVIICQLLYPVLVALYFYYHNIRKSNAFHFDFYLRLILTLFYSFEQIIIFNYFWAGDTMSTMQKLSHSFWDCFDFSFYIISIPPLFFHSAAFEFLNLLRLVHLFHALFQIFDFQSLIYLIDVRLTKGEIIKYEIAKAYVTSGKDVLDLIELISDNDYIVNQLKKEVELEEILLTSDMALAEQIQPWVGSTFKLRQILSATLKQIAWSIRDFQSNGWLSEWEICLLRKILTNNTARAISVVQAVAPSSKFDLFKNVPWMSDNPDLVMFLYSNAYIKRFTSGDTIVQEGYFIGGIYIIISGIVKLQFSPNIATVRFQRDFGILPVCEYLSGVNLLNISQNYLSIGNTVGEFSLLTSRQYDGILTAQTDVVAFLIPKLIVREAFAKFPHILTGLEARMWHSVTAHLGLSILRQIPEYRNYNERNFFLLAKQALVPTFSKLITHFKVNELVKDIVLIEGEVIDSSTKTVYTAPCYVPRTIKLIQFFRNANLTFDSTFLGQLKLMIFPTIDVKDVGIQISQGCTVELVSTSYKICLQHKAINRLYRDSGIRQSMVKKTTNDHITIE